MRLLTHSRPIGLLTLAILTLMLSSVFARPSRAVETTEEVAARSAALDWISAELDKESPSFDIFGAASARTDVVIALATGSRPADQRQALAELRPLAADYIDSATDPAGPLAKVLLAVLINREDPTTFIEGRDLEVELRAHMDLSGMFAGDIFNQSLAVLALAKTAAGVPTEALSALEEAQCANGEFTFLGTCPGTPNSPDVDTTALAVHSLAAAESHEAANRGAQLLATTQLADGSFPNAFGDPNANSAGLAGAALRTTGFSTEGAAAAEFVTSLQTEDGGIKFVASDTASNGYATLQGVLAFSDTPLVDLEAAPFGDVGWGDTFAEEIDWLADAGITKGCNPPTNDRFCPGDSVTRGQMAAFLTRALGLTGVSTTEFVDDNDSEFETDISAIAAADITRGCNPPTNDQFCPAPAADPPGTMWLAAIVARSMRSTVASGGLRPLGNVVRVSLA